MFGGGSQVGIQMLMVHAQVKNATSRSFERRWSITGTMVLCIYCNALMWYDEMPKRLRSGLPHFSTY